jgi:DNA-binding XRE family transcriptional regulator
MMSLARKQDFARYLRDARINRRLSVAEVAELVGVSTESIYFWETGLVGHGMRVCLHFARR